MKRGVNTRPFECCRQSPCGFADYMSFKILMLYYCDGQQIRFESGLESDCSNSTKDIPTSLCRARDHDATLRIFGCRCCEWQDYDYPHCINGSCTVLRVRSIDAGVFQAVPDQKYIARVQRKTGNKTWITLQVNNLVFMVDREALLC